MPIDDAQEAALPGYEGPHRVARTPDQRGPRARRRISQANELRAWSRRGPPISGPDSRTETGRLTLRRRRGNGRNR
jgi:hypothetical protein